MSRSSTLFVLPIVLLLTALGCDGGPKAPPSSSGPPSSAPVQVDFVSPLLAKVKEFEEFTGRTTAMETIELRARVSGYLAEFYFTEGARVEADAALFKIDPRPFVAEKTRTLAAVSQIEARLERLASQERRARQLLEKKAGSQDEYDTAKYDLDEARAAVAEAVALDEIANLDVTFTTVTAPIAGRIGRRMVDVGNLVTADVTILATLISDESLYVYFDMDERTFLKLRRMKSGMDVSADSGNPVETQLEVDIALADSEKFDRKGEVTFFDNQLDSATGTLRVRATVRNPEGILSPGLFVRVRYPVGEPEELLTIPEEALASDQGKPFVFVFGKNDKGEDVAVRRNVELGALVELEDLVEPGAVVRLGTLVEPGSVAAPPTLADSEALVKLKKLVDLGALQGKFRAIRDVSEEEGQPVKPEDQPITSDDKIIFTGLQRLRSGMFVKELEEDDAPKNSSSASPAEP